MRNFKYLTFTLSLLCTPVLFAAEQTSKKELVASVGNLCEHVGTYQKNTKGDKNFCEFKPIFSLALDYPIHAQYSLYPQVSISLPKKSRDKNISKLTYSTLINLVYRPHSFPLSYMLGTGIFFTRLSGNGGKATLNNGVDIEEFQLPGKVMTASNMIVNFGLNYKFKPNISGEIYSYFFNLDNAEDRSYSLGLNFNYHFGEIL